MLELHLPEARSPSAALRAEGATAARSRSLLDFSGDRPTATETSARPKPRSTARSAVPGLCRVPNESEEYLYCRNPPGELLLSLLLRRGVLSLERRNQVHECLNTLIDRTVRNSA